MTTATHTTTAAAADTLTPPAAGGTAAPAGPRRAAELAAGARTMVPWLLGVAPFGLVIGARTASAEIPAVAGWLAAPLLFGGSGHLATVELLDDGAGAAVVVLAALLVNARLVLYSAAMAPWWRGARWWWQALAAATLVEQTLAVGTDAYGRLDRDRAHLRYAGAAMAILATWLVAVTVGMTAGARVPEGVHLEMVIPLFLAGEVVRRLGDRATALAAATAAGAALVVATAPLHVGPVLAIAAGVAVGVSTERRDPQEVRP